uniref:Uncharacterized protein AlNc14C74G5020 n=1 Tax=Albugo laibachii Nc14 TaxID=890382 RepID=F0WEG6_9STRA|nr:conserved hypothetical protein [Albugo laibachii Nc14]|eukprot:CCA19598.1 conserved hypothetical protein [Albugo laibachii Nc14]
MTPVHYEKSWSHLLRPHPQAKEIDYHNSLNECYYGLPSANTLVPDSYNAIPHDYTDYKYPCTQTTDFALQNHGTSNYTGYENHAIPAPTFFDLLMGDSTPDPRVDTELYHFVQDLSLNIPYNHGGLMSKQESSLQYPLNPLSNCSFDSKSCSDVRKSTSPEFGPFDLPSLDANYGSNTTSIANATNTYTSAPFGSSFQNDPSRQCAPFIPQYVPSPYRTPQAVSSAMLHVKTQLRPKYWRNGRRNLQCFPRCESYGDYSLIDLDAIRSHDFMWGKCRGKVEVELALADSGASISDIIVMGRIHTMDASVPFLQAAGQECMSGRLLLKNEFKLLTKKWLGGERSANFDEKSKKAVFNFKPKVWKYSDDMALKKTRKSHIRYYLQFEAFVEMIGEDVVTYHCIASGASTEFEVGSSRVLARQKRKAADKLSSSPPSSAPNEELSPLPIANSKKRRQNDSVSDTLPRKRKLAAQSLVETLNL